MVAGSKEPDPPGSHQGRACLLDLFRRAIPVRRWDFDSRSARIGKGECVHPRRATTARPKSGLLPTTLTLGLEAPVPSIAIFTGS